MARSKKGRSWGNYAEPRAKSYTVGSKPWALNRYAALATKFRKEFPDARQYQRKSGQKILQRKSALREYNRKVMEGFKKKSYFGSNRIGKGNLSNLKWRTILKSAYREPIKRVRRYRR